MRTWTVAELLAVLDDEGLLLVQDVALPSLVTLVAGEPVRGSWWSHAQGQRIYALAGELLEHPDVLSAKLVSRKDTLVHRRLWPEVVTIGRAREPWQLGALTRVASELLVRVDREGIVVTSGDPARELERRLLVVGRGVHTSSGAHAKELVSWERWLEGRAALTADMAVGAAKERLEALVVELEARTGGRARLPWWERVRR